MEWIFFPTKRNYVSFWRCFRIPNRNWKNFIVIIKILIMYRFSTEFGRNREMVSTKRKASVSRNQKVQIPNREFFGRTSIVTTLVWFCLYPIWRSDQPLPFSKVKVFQNVLFWSLIKSISLRVVININPEKLWTERKHQVTWAVTTLLHLNTICPHNYLEHFIETQSQYSCKKFVLLSYVSLFVQTTK